MCVNANVEYLATYKETIETFTGKGKHLCVSIGNVCIIVVHELRPLRFILYSFSFLKLFVTLTKLKVTKIRIHHFANASPSPLWGQNLIYLMN